MSQAPVAEARIDARDPDPSGTRARAARTRPIRVLHVITRMSVGGAQENTMLSCAMIDRDRFPSAILTGPQTGLEGELLSEARDRGVPIVVEPSLVREIDPAKDAVALWRMVRLLRRERWDVVHTHMSKAGILGRLAARMAGVPIVVHTAHGWAFTNEQSKREFQMWVALERMCARWSHAIAVVSRPDQDEALGLGVGQSAQYTLIRSGIDIEAFRDVAIGKDEARRRIDLPVEAFVVGFVGRFTPQKAPLDMIAAFERVARARDDARLVLVGDGDMRGEVEAAIAAAGLGERVRVLGVRRDVPDLMRSFDVLALPSRWEGLPRVFPQAMAARLPIVATRIDGAVEAIHPGENGWLVDVGDVAGFADRLLDVASDRARAHAMGENGFARVDEYSARTMVDRLEILYDRLAHERGLIPPS